MLFYNLQAVAVSEIHFWGGWGWGSAPHLKELAVNISADIIFSIRFPWLVNLFIRNYSIAQMLMLGVK